MKGKGSALFCLRFEASSVPFPMDSKVEEKQ